MGHQQEDQHTHYRSLKRRGKEEQRMFWGKNSRKLPEIDERHEPMNPRSSKTPSRKNSQDPHRHITIKPLKEKESQKQQKRGNLSHTRTLSNVHA